MSKVKDLTGQKFGRLTVIKRVENNKYGTAQWLCKCDCGNENITTTSALINNEAKSCGCLRKEQARLRIKKIMSKHLLCNTRLYNIYSHIKDRCNNNKNDNYRNYGGRGIKVCDDWLNDFKIFYDWAINNGYTDDLTIDRIDVNGNYCPENCRWITQKEQNKNKRTNVYFMIQNKKICLSDISELFNIPKPTIYSWHRRNNLSEKFEQKYGIKIETLLWREK